MDAVRFPVTDVTVTWAMPGQDFGDYRYPDFTIEVPTAEMSIAPFGGEGFNSKYRWSLFYRNPTSGQPAFVTLVAEFWKVVRGTRGTLVINNYGEGGILQDATAPPRAIAAKLDVSVPQDIWGIFYDAAGFRRSAREVSAVLSEALSLRASSNRPPALRSYQQPFEIVRQELAAARNAPSAYLMTASPSTLTSGEILQDILNPEVTPLNPNERNRLLAECASLDSELQPANRRSLFEAARELGLQVAFNATKAQLCQEVTAHLVLANVLNPTLRRVLQGPSSGGPTPRTRKRQVE